MKFYLQPIGELNPAALIKTANSVDYLLNQINNDLLDLESYYILTEPQMEQLKTAYQATR